MKDRLTKKVVHVAVSVQTLLQRLLPWWSVTVPLLLNLHPKLLIMLLGGEFFTLKWVTHDFSS